MVTRRPALPPGDAFVVGPYEVIRAEPSTEGTVTTPLGSWPGLAAAKAACAPDPRTAGRALLWARRRPLLWAASLPAARDIPAVSFAIAARTRKEG